MLSHLVTSVWEKTKIANSYVDIWWCPWDKGGAVIYVIGGTHPPIWLAIDINHHQISNGHAFPSAIKCAHSVWHKSKTSFSVCLSAPVGLERQTRGNLFLKWAKEVAAASHQWKPQMGGEQLKAKILSHDMGMMLARISDARKLRWFSSGFVLVTTEGRRSFGHIWIIYEYIKVTNWPCTIHHSTKWRYICSEATK